PHITITNTYNSSPNNNNKNIKSNEKKSNNEKDTDTGKDVKRDINNKDIEWIGPVWFNSFTKWIDKLEEDEEGVELQVAPGDVTNGNYEKRNVNGVLNGIGIGNGGFGIGGGGIVASSLESLWSRNNGSSSSKTIGGVGIIGGETKKKKGMLSPQSLNDNEQQPLDITHLNGNGAGSSFEDLLVGLSNNDVVGDERIRILEGIVDNEISTTTRPDSVMPSGDGSELGGNKGTLMNGYLAAFPLSRVGVGSKSGIGSTELNNGTDQLLSLGLNPHHHIPSGFEFGLDNQSKSGGPLDIITSTTRPSSSLSVMSSSSSSSLGATWNGFAVAVAPSSISNSSCTTTPGSEFVGSGSLAGDVGVGFVGNGLVGGRVGTGGSDSSLSVSVSNTTLMKVRSPARRGKRAGKGRRLEEIAGLGLRLGLGSGETDNNNNNVNDASLNVGMVSPRSPRRYNGGMGAGAGGMGIGGVGGGIGSGRKKGKGPSLVFGDFDSYDVLKGGWPQQQSQQQHQLPQPVLGQVNGGGNDSNDEYVHNPPLSVLGHSVGMNSVTATTGFTTGTDADSLHHQLLQDRETTLSTSLSSSRILGDRNLRAVGGGRGGGVGVTAAVSMSPVGTSARLQPPGNVSTSVTSPHNLMVDGEVKSIAGDSLGWIGLHGVGGGVNGGTLAAMASSTLKPSLILQHRQQSPLSPLTPLQMSSQQ
ncbi:hypothetical protein HDU76_009539, partial [Blyttiomyces sp. JEL0837]